jgi:hypothetical protein
MNTTIIGKIIGLNTQNQLQLIKPVNLRPINKIVNIPKKLGKLELLLLLFSIIAPPSIIKKQFKDLLRSCHKVAKFLVDNKKDTFYSVFDNQIFNFLQQKSNTQLLIDCCFLIFIFS